MNEDFIIFFREKRIDIEALKKSREVLYDELEQTFLQIGAQSFDQQKKFIFNPLRLDFPLDLPIEEKAKPKKGKLPPKKKIPLPNKDKSAVEAETKKRKAPPLKKPLMKKAVKEGEAGKKPAKAPPLKRPIMKRKSEGKEEEKDRPKPPPLKRPIMKRKTEGDEDKKPKKPPLKKPIMKPRKPKD